MSQTKFWGVAFLCTLVLAYGMALTDEKPARAESLGDSASATATSWVTGLFGSSKAPAPAAAPEVIGTLQGGAAIVTAPGATTGGGFWTKRSGTEKWGLTLSDDASRPAGAPAGPVVVAVTPDGPAAQRGVQLGDVVVGVSSRNGKNRTLSLVVPAQHND